MNIKITHAIAIEVQVNVNGNETLTTLNLNGLNLGDNILRIINKEVKTMNIEQLKNLGLFDTK